MPKDGPTLDHIATILHKRMRSIEDERINNLVQVIDLVTDNDCRSHNFFEYRDIVFMVHIQVSQERLHATSGTKAKISVERNQGCASFVRSALQVRA